MYTHIYIYICIICMYIYIYIYIHIYYDYIIIEGREEGGRSGRRSRSPAPHVVL